MSPYFHKQYQNFAVLHDPTHAATYHVTDRDILYVSDVQNVVNSTYNVTFNLP